MSEDEKGYCKLCGEKHYLYKDEDSGMWLCGLCLDDVQWDKTDRRKDE